MQSEVIKSDSMSLVSKTYLLLSGTLIWTAVVAYLSMGIELSLGFLIGSLVVSLALLFGMHIYRKNEPVGLALLLLFTGIEGVILGPFLTKYLELPNGGELIATAFAVTGVIFISLSAYVHVSRKEFSFLFGFLIAALVSLILLMVAAIFIQSEALHLALAYLSILVIAGCVLYDTSNLIHGREDSYITATVGLYLDIIIIFKSMLRILK